jgi:hypothetical protein
MHLKGGNPVWLEAGELGFFEMQDIARLHAFNGFERGVNLAQDHVGF